MHRRTTDELIEVSRYWTPDHLDVTNVPMTYARPKAPWIDDFKRLRRRLSSDASERLARRRLHTHAVVDPNEITVLPPLPPPPVSVEPEERHVAFALALLGAMRRHAQ